MRASEEDLSKSARRTGRQECLPHIGSPSGNQVVGLRFEEDCRPKKTAEAVTPAFRGGVAHETRWLKRLLGNFRGLSSACFLGANGREFPRIPANGIHGERQSFNRADKVGRSVPVSRWDERTRGI